MYFILEETDGRRMQRRRSVMTRLLMISGGDVMEIVVKVMMVIVMVRGMMAIPMVIMVILMIMNMVMVRVMVISWWW